MSATKSKKSMPSASPALYPSLQTEKDIVTDDDDVEEEEIREISDQEDGLSPSAPRNRRKTSSSPVPSPGSSSGTSSSGGSRNRSLSRRSIHDSSRGNLEVRGSPLESNTQRHSNQRNDEIPRHVHPGGQQGANYGPDDAEFWKTLETGVKQLLLLLAACFLVLFLGFFGFTNMFAPEPAKFFKKVPDSFEIFKKELVKMKTRFPHQEKHSWILIRAAVKPVLNFSDPQQPSVLLLASSDSNTLDCFARDLAAAAGKAYDSNFPEFQAGSYANSDGKLRLDDNLRSAFEQHHQNVVLLRGIDKLISDAALVLHAYCDNDNAPHKDAVIILTVYLSEGVGSTDNCDSVVQSFLKRSWSIGENGLNADKIGALLTRVANNVLCVNSEPNLSC